MKSTSNIQAKKLLTQIQMSWKTTCCLCAADAVTRTNVWKLETSHIFQIMSRFQGLFWARQAYRFLRCHSCKVYIGPTGRMRPLEGVAINYDNIRALKDRNGYWIMQSVFTYNERIHSWLTKWRYSKMVEVWCSRSQTLPGEVPYGIPVLQHRTWLYIGRWVLTWQIRWKTKLRIRSTGQNKIVTRFIQMRAFETARTNRPSVP